MYLIVISILSNYVCGDIKSAYREHCCAKAYDTAFIAPCLLSGNYTPISQNSHVVYAGWEYMTIATDCLTPPTIKAYHPTYGEADWSSGLWQLPLGWNGVIVDYPLFGTFVDALWSVDGDVVSFSYGDETYTPKNSTDSDYRTIYSQWRRTMS